MRYWVPRPFHTLLFTAEDPADCEYSIRLSYILMNGDQVNRAWSEWIRRPVRTLGTAVHFPGRADDRSIGTADHQRGRVIDLR